MLIEDLINGRKREPLAVRMLRRAIQVHGSIYIDLKVRSGRKHGWLVKVEDGAGWTNELGEKIPTYRFTYERHGSHGIGTFELPAELVDRDVTVSDDGYGDLFVTNAPTSVTEMEVAGEPPVWFNIINSGLKKGRKFYFASGGNRIWDLYTQPNSLGKQVVVLRLEHVKRMKNGQPDRQTYTIWDHSFPDWTLVKHGDGHKLTMRDNVKKVTEAADEPPVVSMFKKLRDAGRDVFGVNAAGKRTRLVRVATDLTTSGNRGWWFFDGSPGGGRAVFWKIGDNINRLTLKKDGDVWLLYDKTRSKLDEGRGGDPLIITLMNKQLEKLGAVAVSITQNPGQQPMKGWITEPIKLSPFSQPEDPYYATHVQTAIGKKKVFIFYQDADARYTLKREKHKNGQVAHRLVDRGDSDAAE